MREAEITFSGRYRRSFMVRIFKRAGKRTGVRVNWVFTGSGVRLMFVSFVLGYRFDTYTLFAKGVLKDLGIALSGWAVAELKNGGVMPLVLSRLPQLCDMTNYLQEVFQMLPAGLRDGSECELDGMMVWSGGEFLLDWVGHLAERMHGELHTDAGVRKILEDFKKLYVVTRERLKRDVLRVLPSILYSLGADSIESRRIDGLMIISTRLQGYRCSIYFSGDYCIVMVGGHVFRFGLKSFVRMYNVAGVLDVIRSCLSHYLAGVVLDSSIPIEKKEFRCGEWM